MLRKVGLVAGVLIAGVAEAQMAREPSPLPVFDTESGVPFVLESIIGPDALQNIEMVRDTTHYDMAKIVARVEDPAGEGFCTGFRVGEDLFMTNYHCWEVADCALQFHMGYETSLPTEEHAIFKCTQVLTRLESLDFALYRVERTDANRTVDFPIATLTRKPRVMNMELLVPGHPAARPKQIDVSADCKLTRVEPYDYYDRKNIQHQCDTLGGSSGSPVVDRSNGHVLGIHWGAAGSTGSNHAIPMDLILDHLETNLPDAYAELTVEE